MPDRFLMDTSYVLARINRGDKYHAEAMRFASRVEGAAQVWTTEALLIEIGDGAAAANRVDAIRFVKRCYRTENIHVVPITANLLERAVSLYERRSDKEWGLTDCISFVVMKDHGLTDALTADHHFTQAGFRALLREA